MGTREIAQEFTQLCKDGQFEEAGRALKQWLDRLLGHAQPHEDTEIEWEDGEPRHDRRDGISPGH